MLKREAPRLCVCEIMDCRELLRTSSARWRRPVGGCWERRGWCWWSPCPLPPSPAKEELVSPLRSSNAQLGRLEGAPGAPAASLDPGPLSPQAPLPISGEGLPEQGGAGGAAGLLQEAARVVGGGSCMQSGLSGSPSSAARAGSSPPELRRQVLIGVLRGPPKTEQERCRAEVVVAAEEEAGLRGAC